MGFYNVTTYLQSGNVIFSCNDIEINNLEQKISLQIEKDFGFEVPVIVLTIDKLQKVIECMPVLKDPDFD